MTCSYAMEGCLTHGQNTNLPEASMPLPPEYFIFLCSHQAMPCGIYGGQSGNGANCFLSILVSLFIDDPLIFHSSTTDAI